MLCCNRVSVLSRFRDNGPQAYGCHDLDLSRSRDVIGHMTNRSAICHFLLVPHCNQTCISNRFRDIRPPIPVRAPSQTQTHAANDFIFCPMQCIALDRQQGFIYAQALTPKVYSVCEVDSQSKENWMESLLWPSQGRSRRSGRSGHGRTTFSAELVISLLFDSLYSTHNCSKQSADCLL